MPELAMKASLGCGNPTALAELQAGETVLDLGSGGGIDVLLSARRVGPTGKAYRPGHDRRDARAGARRTSARAGSTNVEFLKGEIENIPLPDNSVDVIISNCVINLSADKDRVLREAFRVLKPGGRFAVSDVVVRGDVPAEIRKSMELWVGCVAGALEDDEYVAKLEAAGFEDDRHRADAGLRRRGCARVPRRRGARRGRARHGRRRTVHQRVRPSDQARPRACCGPGCCADAVKPRVLILCTGNSARSQMAEGLLRYDRRRPVRGGVAPARSRAPVRPEAIAAMARDRDRHLGSALEARVRVRRAAVRRRDHRLRRRARDLPGLSRQREASSPRVRRPRGPRGVPPRARRAAVRTWRPFRRR